MYNHDDVRGKVDRFQNIRGTISKMPEQKVLAIYKVMALPMLLCGSES